MKKINDEIFNRTVDILMQKYVYITCIALSAGIAGMLMQNIHTTRLLHAIICGLLCGIIAITMYTCLFITIYGVFYLPKAVTWKGNIHRLEYFIVMLCTMIIFLLVKFIYEPEYYGLDYRPTNFMLIFGFTIVFFLIYVQTCTGIKRLNDLKWSKWLAILHIIPIVSLAIRIPCLFAKGKYSEESI